MGFGNTQTRDNLAAFFSPRGIAVIGASQNPKKLGYGLVRNLIQSNYQGSIHLVNPNGGKLLDLPIYEHISLVPDPVDLAFILIPARSISKVLHDCGQRGLLGVIIGSGGFRETGPAGAALEEECLRIIKSHRMRMIGPNSIGLLDTHQPLDATFLPPLGPLPGDIAFISHSGAICATVIDWARGQNFGLSRLVSLGNQADVNETDVLAPVAADPFTRVLTLYLEGVGNGRKFVAEAEKISKQKPLIALKVGRFMSGQEAVASHTGALAGQDDAFNAAFRRAGVLRADTSEEMFDWARALAWCPLPNGRAVAVLTNAGGPGVTAADALELNGMQLTELDSVTIEKLRSLLPPAASLKNPVDMLASASPEHYAKSLQFLLDDENVDSVLIIIPPPPMYTAGSVAKALIPVIQRSNKPVVITLMGERLIQEAVEQFRAARIPEYRFPERAASALAVLVRRAEYLEISKKAESEPPEVEYLYAKSLLEPFLDKRQGAKAFLPQQLANELIQAYGIPLPESKLVHTVEEAVEFADKIGYPVALKIASQEIIHKSEIRGVLLNLQDAKTVSHGFTSMINEVGGKHPEAIVHGIYVQRMVSKGQEVIVGSIQDPQFGPLIMFGSGGVEVEGVKDVTFALAPIDTEEIDYLLENTWAGKKLSGFRNMFPSDRPAVKDVLLRVAQLAIDFTQIAEVEINPLIVLQDGEGAYAVDVRIRLAEKFIPDTADG